MNIKFTCEFISRSVAKINGVVDHLQARMHFLTFFLCCDAWSRCVDRQHFGRREKCFRSRCVTDRTAWNHFWRSDDSEGNACRYHPLDIGLQGSILWASPTASKSCCQNYQVSWPRFCHLHLLLICHSVNDCTALIRVILQSHQQLHLLIIIHAIHFFSERLR